MPLQVSTLLIGSGLLIGSVALMMILGGFWCLDHVGGVRAIISELRPGGANAEPRRSKQKRKKKLRSPDDDEGTAEGLLGGGPRKTRIEYLDDDEHTVLDDDGREEAENDCHDIEVAQGMAMTTSNADELAQRDVRIPPRSDGAHDPQSEVNASVSQQPPSMTTPGEKTRQPPLQTFYDMD